jgi:hypothetical protein
MSDFVGSPAHFLLGFFYLYGLFRIIRSALDPNNSLSPAARRVRLYGGGLLAALAVTGMALLVWRRFS